MIPETNRHRAPGYVMRMQSRCHHPPGQRVRRTRLACSDHVDLASDLTVIPVGDRMAPIVHMNMRIVGID